MMRRRLVFAGTMMLSRFAMVLRGLFMGPLANRSVLSRNTPTM
jgi:hypothetical protein